MALILTLGSGAVSADADGPDFYQLRNVAADDVLNIRARPNPRARIVGAIPPDGARIRNLGCQARIIFQQGGPEPLDAYRTFLQTRERQGAFAILNPAFEAEFWK